jgi:hypothetical protein
MFRIDCVEFILRPTVSRPVRLGIGLPFGAHYHFILPFFSDNCFVVLPVGSPLWREDRFVTYSAIADWSGHWGPITIHYRVTWDCFPFSSPLTTLRDYGGVILTRLHTGCLASLHGTWYTYHSNWAHLNFVTHKFLPSVSVFVYICTHPIIARQKLSKHVPAAKTTCNI